jgi:hypothetical protein
VNGSHASVSPAICGQHAMFLQFYLALSETG